MHTIRKIIKNDFEEVLTVAEKTIRQCYSAFFKQEELEGYISSGSVEQEFETHFNNCYVLITENRIIGFTIFFDDFIHLMMIDSDCHNSGWGSILLRYAERELRKNGLNTLRLETMKENIQAVKFYEKNGWKITDCRPEKGLNVHRVFMKKNFQFEKSAE